MRLRRRFVAPILIVVLALLTGCVGGAKPFDRGPTEARSGGGLRYGLAPEPNKGVTFEKDVVLVQGGASSIRSVTADGLTWTIVPTAPGAADLKPGRVMFLTDRAVGRVLKLEHTGGDLAVTLGPVTLTDVIRDGHFASTKPIPLANPIAISAQNAIWEDPSVQQQAGVTANDQDVVPDQSTTTTPSAFLRPVSGPGSAPRQAVANPAVLSNLMDTSTGKVGAKTSFDGRGIHLPFRYPANDDPSNRFVADGEVDVDMHSPTGQFDLDLGAGKINLARLTVSGAVDVRARIHVVTRPNSPVNGKTLDIARGYEFVIPIPAVLGVPLSMVVQQTFKFGLVIPGEAVFNGGGVVKLATTLGAKYQDGKFYNLSSADFDGAGSLNLTNSIAVGISQAQFWYDIRFTVGIGVMGFVAGVFFDLGTNIYALVGAPIGYNQLPGASSPIEQCRAVSGTLFYDFGVGYKIPRSVTSVINWFLDKIKVRPIAGQGGYSPGWQSLATMVDVQPKSGFCTSR